MEARVASDLLGYYRQLQFLQVGDPLVLCSTTAGTSKYHQSGKEASFP